MTTYQTKSHYLAKCSECSARVHASAVWTHSNYGQTVTLDSAASTVWSPDYGRTVYARCECGANVRPARIKARRTEETCSAKCQNARKASCECECAGANHGAGGVLV
jgi:hypothetical protein